MGLFDAFRKARLPERKPSDEPVAGFGWMRGTRTSIVPYDRVISSAAALRHPVVFRCLKKIGEAVQSVEWICEQDETVPENARAAKNHVADINALLKNPHDSIPPDMLRYWMAIVFATYARVPFLVGQGVGKANAIYPLDAAQTTAVHNERGSITSYNYGLNDKKSYPSKKSAADGKAYVYEITSPNLSGSMDDIDRPSPLGAIGLPAEITGLLLSRAYDTASGAPNIKFVVSSDKPLTMSQQNALREHMDEAKPGGEESGNVLMIHGATVKIDRLDDGLADLHSKVPMDDMTRMIAGAYGVPIALLGLGAADAAKFAGNYAESRRAFWEETVIPGYLTPIAKGLTAALCQPGCYIRFDLDTVEALADARVARAKNLTGVDYLTDDEKRELAGYPKMTEEQKREIADRRAANKPVAAPPADPNTNPTN